MPLAADAEVANRHSSPAEMVGLAFDDEWRALAEYIAAAVATRLEGKLVGACPSIAGERNSMNQQQGPAVATVERERPFDSCGSVLSDGESRSGTPRSDSMYTQTGMLAVGREQPSARALLGARSEQAESMLSPGWEVKALHRRSDPPPGHPMLAVGRIEAQNSEPCRRGRGDGSVDIDSLAGQGCSPNYSVPFVVPKPKLNASATRDVASNDRLSRFGQISFTRTQSLEVDSGTSFRSLERQRCTATGCLSCVVKSEYFNFFCTGVIIANTVIAIMKADTEARHLEPAGAWIEVVDFWMTMWYTVEVSLKLLVYKKAFFYGEDSHWNMLDFSLVVIAMAELLLISSGGAGVFRGVRIFKIVRTVRIFKVLRFLRDLRMMMKVVFQSFSTLLWSCLLLAFVLLVAALLFVQVMTGLRQENPDFDDVTMLRLVKWFGSIPSGMLILFQSTTGGVSWGDVYDIVSLQSVTSGFGFVGFIIFFQMAIFNIITSIFVDKAMRLGQPEEDDAVAERLDEARADERKLRELVNKLDIESSGDITLDQLEDSLRKPEIREYFQLQGLNIRDVKLFFKTLSAMYPNDGLKIDAFVDGCMKVKGHASSLDMQAMKIQTHAITDLLLKIADHLRILPTGSSRMSNLAGNSRALSRLSRTTWMGGLDRRIV